MELCWGNTSIMCNESLRNLQLGASQRVWLILWAGTLSRTNFTLSTFSVYDAHNDGLNTAYFGGYTTLIPHNL